MTQVPCCDLLAQSAHIFSKCGNIVRLIAAAQRNFAFSVTNSGGFLSRIKPHIDFDSGCYVLPLLCHEEGTPLDGIYLALKIWARLVCEAQNLLLGAFVSLEAKS